jgi:hypothetical protein
MTKIDDLSQTGRYRSRSRSSHGFATRVPHADGLVMPSLAARAKAKSPETRPLTPTFLQIR